MKNPIYENKENLKFIEENLGELSKSIGSAAHVNEYYIDVFKHEKPVFNLEAFIFGSWWFGYRKMYLSAFLISLVRGLIIQVLGLIVVKTNATPEMLAEEDIITVIIIGIIMMVIIIALIIFNLLIAKYANYIYFRSLKTRIIKKRRYEYGKSVGGAFGGVALATLADFAARAIGMLIIGMVV